MAVEMYLQIDGITGESQKSGVQGWIEVTSFSFGGSNPSGVLHGMGSGTGKWTPESFNIVKSVDAATPGLFALNASGGHQANAKFIARLSTGGSTTQTFFEYDMTEVYVDSITWTGSEASSGKPQENVSMSAKTHQITYTIQNADGSMGSPVIKGWDVSKNQAM
jgi:type VI secretion system secreted protein Hcp